MDKQQRDRDIMKRCGMEAVLFLVATAVGIYGLGQGLTGLMITGQPIRLGWLAVAGVAFYVLSAQMARVHDSWPHRPSGSRPAHMGTLVRDPQEPPASPESR